MTKIRREGLLVARMPGSRMFLAGASGSRPVFEGPGERTIFFQRETVDKELRSYGVDPTTVELKPAMMELEIF
jgi:hypothetical protein